MARNSKSGNAKAYCDEHAPRRKNDPIRHPNDARRVPRSVGRPTVIDSGPLVPLVEHAGGVVLLAESSGVSRKTLQRIGLGGKASPAVRAVLNAWATRRGLAIPFPRAA